MKIGVIGLGKVGGLISLYLSRKHEVVGVDKNDDYNTLKDVSALFVAVPTPFNSYLNTLDTSIVKEVISLFLNVNKKAFIFIKSTMPVGATRKIKEELKYERIFYTPEFIRNYDNVDSLDDIDRSIIGLDEDDVASDVYFSLFQGSRVNLTMSLEEAEAVKLFSNAYLAYRINFFNEISEFSNANNLISENIIEGVSLDSRIGNHYNKPSFGYAGKCLPKDVKALAALCKDIPTDVINKIDEVNELRIESYYQEIMKYVAKGEHPVVGFNNYVDSNNALLLLIEKLRKNNIQMVMYIEPNSTVEDTYGIEVINNLKTFYQIANVVVDLDVVQILGKQ